MVAQDPWRFLAVQGWLRVPHGSLTPSGSASGAAVCTQLRQHFSKVAGCLQALSGDLLEFCRQAAAQAGRAAALAGLCRLSNRGQMQEF